MAGFNGSGSFVRSHDWTTDLGNSVPVTASRMDTEHDGFATGLSNTICRDGQSTTTAAIPFAQGVRTGDGSVSAPAYAFSSDTGSGWYRIGSKNLGLAIDGAKVVDVSTATAAITGTVTVSGGLTVAGLINNGHIRFPATANATAEANTLDDYEEGTWTPVLQFDGASVDMTFSTQVGTYTKIGRTVKVSGILTLSALGSSTGAATIGGLPFTVGAYSACPMRVTALNFSPPGGMQAYFEPTTTTISLHYLNGANTAGTTEGGYTSTSNFIFGGTYDI